ncbi:hypothetical protein FH972_015681 [Carpinus fangiana]|uniref:Uncharacterized protein n=1 Tax=Carpinus fangiana TaxID=176857 RepID=A0A5N6RE34_9ROSI|nr:hypothetical protein FH972_015681 [Carpinus fangiana]
MNFILEVSDGDPPEKSILDINFSLFSSSTSKASLEHLKKVDPKSGKYMFYEFKMECDRCQSQDVLSCSLKGTNTGQRQKWKVKAGKVSGAALTREGALAGRFEDFMRVECSGAIPTGFTFGTSWIITLW